MKKVYFLTFLFIGFFLFGQQKPLHNNQPHYTDAQLAGFDKTAAWIKAQQKSSNPNVQAEIFESMKKSYVASHQNRHSYTNSTTQQANNRGINTNPSVLSTYCPNSGFDLINFNNWTGQTGDANPLATWTLAPTWAAGTVPYTPQPINSPLALGAGAGQTLYDASFNQLPTDNRHNIMTMATINNNPANGAVMGYDSLAINPTTNLADIPVVCPTGGGVSLRLGNANTGSETESITYLLPVSSSNALYTYQYAVVMSNPISGHTSDTQPFFEISLLDQNGNPIVSPCAIYNVNSDSAANPRFGFIENTGSQYNGNLDVYYKNWTPVTVDLTPYIGQTITVQFRTADCSQGGHFGYAYIDASCGSTLNSITTSMCHGSTIQQITAPVGFSSYQWFGPNANTLIPAPQGTGDTLMISNGAVGDTYTVQCVSPTGCTSYLQAILQFSTVSITNTNSSPSCIGGFSGSANVTAIGSPNGNYSYAWVNSAGQTVATTNPSNSLAPGIYTVQVSAPGCGSHDTTVVVTTSPPFIQNQTKNFCGSAAYLTLPAGSTGIQWYSPGGVLIPGSNNDTLLATGASNGQVYIASYSNSGCKDSMLITLTQISGGTLSHNVLANVCSDNTYGQFNYPDSGKVTINLSTTAAPPYNYSIVGPGFSASYPTSTATSIPLSGLAYGSYTVAAFDGTCFYSDIFTIDTIPVPVNITIAPTTLCNGANALLTFTFNSAPPTQCQTSSLPCTNPTTYTCGPSNTVTPSSTSYPTPYGNYYTKMRAQYIYTATELIAAGINAGNLNSIAFNITNLNSTISSYPNFNISVGCSGQSTFTSASDETSLITGLTNIYSSANANITTGINTYPFSQPYSWDGVSNLIVDVCFEVPGTYSYTTNAQVSCSNTSNYSSLTIVSDTDPTCNLSTSTSAYYYSYPVQMRPVAAFGWCNSVANASMYNYSLLNTNLGVVTNLNGALTDTIKPTSTTHYILTTTTNYGGLSCYKTDSFTLHVIQPFSIIPNRDSLFCTSTNSVSLNATFIDNTTHSPVSEPATWSVINGSAGLTGNNGFGSANFSPHDAGVGTYSLVVSAGGQCVVTDTVVFKVDTFNTAKFIVPDSVFCLTDGNVQLRPTTPGGTWSGLGVSSNGIFSPYTTGVTTPYTTIKYVVNAGTPCADSSTAQMQVISNPTVTFITDTMEGCVPTPIGFSSTVIPTAATGSYLWYFSDGQTSTSQNTSHTYTLTGLYSPKVVYTDVNGCRDSSTHLNSIIVHPKPTVSFYANPATTDVLAPHVDFTNTTVPANCTWAWDIAGLDTSSSKNTSHNFDDPGHFIIQLTATTPFNCKDVYALDLSITGAYALYVPSAFTPNGDGKNELFKPDGFGLADNNIGYKMDVYDRWGQRLFESTDVNTGWDGSKNGVALGQDIYVYSITFKDYDGKTHTQKGQVMLLR